MNNLTPDNLTPYQQIIRNLSDRIVRAQQSIRILDSVKWSGDIQEQFFQSKFKKLPAVDAAYYQRNPLPFDPTQKLEEFHAIERDIRRQLGQHSAVGGMMQNMCQEYETVIRMLEARGTADFSSISQELYGSTEEPFHAGAPTLKDLSVLIAGTLQLISDHVSSEADKKILSSEQAVEILGKRLADYFGESNYQVRVFLDDGIISDAAAGADYIKIRREAVFSERELRQLEVHEGWVHVGTTLNGWAQPVCTFLSKGAPSSTVIQEGLATIMEIFNFASNPSRVQRINERVIAINMVEQGADFMEIFQHALNRGLSEEEAYSFAVRVFRGSAPTLGPFTKDLSYSKGFILLYNYIRLAIQRGLLSHIPLLFVGKTNLESINILSDLLNEGIIVPPKYLPPHIKDMSGLSAWMCYSLFLNQIDLQRLSLDFKKFFQE